jgi:hypothetical protein
VPAAKFRTWSVRGVGTEGLVQMGVPTMRVRAESVPTFNFLQKLFRTLAKGETKSNKINIFEEV